jgi:23S rRNA pseudouridine2605 synthase
MKNKLKPKATAPVAKRAPKSASMSKKTAAKSKVVVASKATSTKAKTATVKAKTPAAKTKATKAKPAEKPVAKRAAKATKPAAESKQSGAKTGRRKVKIQDAAGLRIGEPVLDPIGDVVSGEAKMYLGDVEAQARAEMGASRAEAATMAPDAAIEAGPGMAAAEAANKFGGGEAGGGGGATGAVAEDDEAAAEAGADAQAPAKLERLQKILSRAGIASRRHAEEMMVAGRVMVNGQVVTQLGSKADPTRDHIRVDGKLLHGAERHRYFVLNKPKGYVTTVSDPEGRPTVMEFFAKTHERLYPVGRLDYLSEGLLLMTNDGELANLVTKAGSGVEKTYLVKVAGQPSDEEMERLRGGVAIERDEAGSERVRTAPARIRKVREGENPWYEVVLTEGRNRELRKMFAAIGHFAEKIRRVGYGPLVLDVEPGKLRELSADEVNALRMTAEGKLKPRRIRMDLVLPKEAGRAAEKRSEKPAGRWRDKAAGKRFDRAPARGGKPFRKPDERGQRTEWKPREREFRGGEGGAVRSGERTGFDKRGSRPQRASSDFGKRPNKPFGARPEFRKTGEGLSAGEAGGFGERPRPKFGERRPFPGGQRPFGGGRPSTGPKPRFERAGFVSKPRGQAEGRSENATQKPFRAQGERPFVKEGDKPKKRFDGEKPPFKRGDEPKRRFEGERGKGFDKGAKFGAKPGGFAKFRGKGGGGKKFGGSRPGAARGGWKRGSTRKPQP